MKQIEKTQRIRDLLTASLGAGADLDALRVYEAIALNTLPIRKEHPLYKGARADRNFLLEMASALTSESRPVQIQHDKDPLPIGRVFHGEVVDTGVDSELRVLFFLDPTANEQATKIEAGSVDQVSVSILAKQMINSVSGFDYFGADASSDNIWSGVDNKGNQVGKDGVFARMVGLAKFFEMSLVGQGGAQNARIISRERSHFGESFERLAASGMDPNGLVLNATSTPKEPIMEFAELISDISTKATEIANLNVQITSANAKTVTLEASVATHVATIADLNTQLEAAKAVDVAAVTGERDAAVAALSDVAQKVLTKVGKLNVELPKTVTELSALIDENAAVLAITPGGKAKESITDLANTPTPRAAAFRVAAR